MDVDFGVISCFSAFWEKVSTFFFFKLRCPVLEKSPSLVCFLKHIPELLDKAVMFLTMNHL